MERMTKGELVEQALPKKFSSFDYALPQPWVDAMHERGFDDVPAHFIWVYPSNSISGFPYPITAKGVEMLARISVNI